MISSTVYALKGFGIAFSWVHSIVQAGKKPQLGGARWVVLGSGKLHEEQRRSFLAFSAILAYAENAGFLGINAWHSLLLRLNSAPSHFA